MSLGSSSGRQLTCDKFPEVRHFKKDLQYNEEMDFDEMEQINKNEYRNLNTKHATGAFGNL